MSEPLRLSPMSQTIAAVIPFGKRNAMSRSLLAERLGLGDRQMRRAIEVARTEGIIILNDQDGRGYYQSADEEDLGRQYRQDTDRALSILARRKQLRLILKEMGVLDKYERQGTASSAGADDERA